MSWLVNLGYHGVYVTLTLFHHFRDPQGTSPTHRSDTRLMRFCVVGGSREDHLEGDEDMRTATMTVAVLIAAGIGGCGQVYKQSWTRELSDNEALLTTPAVRGERGR